MIQLAIVTDGKKVADKLDIKKATMSEVAITLMKLEHIKKGLLEMKFDAEVSIQKPLDDEDKKDA